MLPFTIITTTLLAYIFQRLGPPASTHRFFLTLLSSRAICILVSFPDVARGGTTWKSDRPPLLSVSGAHCLGRVGSSGGGDRSGGGRGDVAGQSLQAVRAGVVLRQAKAEHAERAPRAPRVGDAVALGRAFFGGTAPEALRSFDGDEGGRCQVDRGKESKETTGLELHPWRWGRGGGGGRLVVWL